MARTFPIIFFYNIKENSAILNIIYSFIQFILAKVISSIEKNLERFTKISFFSQRDYDYYKYLNNEFLIKY